jgi:hypothetical protein
VNTRRGTPEDFTASYAYIEVFGAHGLKCWEARRTGIEVVCGSGKAIYELVDLHRRPVSNILYVIDDQALVPVAEFRAAYRARKAAGE